MRFVLGIAALALASGCGDDLEREYPTKPRQDEALRIASTAIGVRQPPPVEWIEGDRLAPCPTAGTGFTVPVGDVNLCVGGWTFPGLIQVAWVDNDQPWSWGALAHELGHTRLIELTGSADGGEDHRLKQGPIWGPDGTVAQARAALVAAGL